MTIDPLTIPHLVTAPYRVVPNRAHRVFDSIPGEVPFARMLQAQNRVARIEGRVEPIDTYEPTAEPSRDPQVALLPKLGEVLPVAPTPRVQPIVDVRHQVNAPATGRVLDLYL